MNNKYIEYERDSLHTELSGKLKAKVKQSNDRPGQAKRFPRRLRLPDFKTIGT